MIPILAMTRVLFVGVSGWSSPTGIDEEINSKLEILENSIDRDKQSFRVKNIKILSDTKAFVVYEILDRDVDVTDDLYQGD
jgi:hypothetical protein